jgi:hypothetical protein
MAYERRPNNGSRACQSHAQSVVSSLIRAGKAEVTEAKMKIFAQKERLTGGQTHFSPKRTKCPLTMKFKMREGNRMGARRSIRYRPVGHGVLSS